MALRYIALLALLVLGVLVSGCCCCGNYVPGQLSLPPTATPGPGIDDSIPSGTGNDLTGSWSSDGPYGTLYDPATGATTGSSYSGEWYIFRGDGTYRYVIISSGLAISGSVARDGKYSLDGSDIQFYDNTESWYPDPSRSNEKPSYKNKPADDVALSYDLQDPDTVSIDGSTYYRIKQ